MNYKKSDNNEIKITYTHVCKKIMAASVLCMSLVFPLSANAGAFDSVKISPVKVGDKEIVIPSKPTSTETQDAATEDKSSTESITDDKKEKTTESTETGTSEDTSKEVSSDSKNGWNAKKTAYYENGKKVTGWYTIDEKLYYFSKKGVLYKKTGLNTIGDKTYYFDDDHYVLSGVIKDDGKSYYFSKNGGARLEKVGVSKADKKYYCVNDDFSLKKGWYRDKKNKRYYFDKKTFEGKTGWNYVGKYKYFFNKKAQLVQDVRKKLTKTQKEKYVIRVNRTASCVTVYAKDGMKGYTIPVVAFVCSAGKDTPTGTFTIKDKLRWHELMGPCWGQWCMHLTVDILFHSVYYDKDRDNKSLNVAAYNRLGTMASHGCVRMTAGDCKWIYDNCNVGTKVIIYNNKKNPGPFDKPVAKKLSANHTWDPTDPAFK